MSRISSFKYVEYNGEDAADVLVTLLMNLAHPELAGPHGEQEGSVIETPSETELHERVVGFTPNEIKDEDDDEEGQPDGE